MGYLTMTAAQYLPTQVTDTLAQSRAWATVSMPKAGVPTIVTIATVAKQTRLMLASADGYFYIYNIPEEGGDCVMVKQHFLDPVCGGEGRDSPAFIPDSREEHRIESPNPGVQVEGSSNIP